jgi:flavin reductase (DIM6/NTAB) family NADH-FMN oxidoreductase RutF
MAGAQRDGAAWSMPLDFEPPKVAVVIDKTTLTRELVEASGEFVLNLPPVALAQATLQAGRESGREQADKAAHCGLSFMPASRVQPLVQGCIGWLECRVLPTSAAVAGPHDLFLAEVLAAWADERVFRNGRWCFEQAEPGLRSLHYVAGGHFYAVGEALDVALPATGAEPATARKTGLAPSPNRRAR